MLFFVLIFADMLFLRSFARSVECKAALHKQLSFSHLIQ